MKPAAAGRGIRDKIAAFKRKGIRTGGPVPLGYDAEDRELIGNPAEAGIVCRLFALYLDSARCGALRIEAQRLGLTTKRRIRIPDQALAVIRLEHALSETTRSRSRLEEAVQN